MSAIGEALKALRTVLMMQEDVRVLKQTAADQSERLAQLAEAHGHLRDRVARLEGFIEGAAMASGNRRPRIEG